MRGGRRGHASTRTPAVDEEPHTGRYGRAARSDGPTSGSTLAGVRERSSCPSQAYIAYNALLSQRSPENAARTCSNRDRKGGHVFRAAPITRHPRGADVRGAPSV